MTISTFFPETSDGFLTSNNAVYATALAGSNESSNNTNSTGTIGQFSTGDPLYFIYEQFIQWDTSALTADATISVAVVSLYGSTDSSATDFIINAYLYNWGVSLTTADWRDDSELGALTELATFNTSGFSISAYNDFTETNTNLVDNVSKTGNTIMAFASLETENASVPGDDPDIERVNTHMTEETGTTKDPKLVVTFSIPGSDPPFFNQLARGPRAAMIRK